MNCPILRKVFNLFIKYDVFVLLMVQSTQAFQYHLLLIHVFKLQLKLMAPKLSSLLIILNLLYGEVK